MLYRLKVRALKTRVGVAVWARYRRRAGDRVGSYSMLPELIRRLAPGRTFVDIGCMWGIDGEFAFVAEEAGAKSVKGVDVFGPTDEFLDKRRRRNSNVEFILGDAGSPETIRRVGRCQVVFSAGVLYHHPSPFELLVALRAMCEETLILRTAAVPETVGVRNMAVFWPYLDEGERRLWNLARRGIGPQLGITDAFDPGEGYGSWFWGLTPSCLDALLMLAGFRVVESYPEPFSQTRVCAVVASPFAAELEPAAGASADPA